MGDASATASAKRSMVARRGPGLGKLRACACSPLQKGLSGFRSGGGGVSQRDLGFDGARFEDGVDEAVTSFTHIE